MPCLTVRTKGLREFKQRLLTQRGEDQRMLKYQTGRFSMLNCRKKNDCTSVRGNYSALSDAVNVGKHRNDFHMVFHFTRYNPISFYSSKFQL